jgi:hydroxyacylglutathione hydrolase
MVLSRGRPGGVRDSSRPALLAALADEVPEPVQIIPVDVFGTGNRTYLASSDGQAVVVDPPRDIGSLLELAGDRGWAITHVVETHVHNDYVSGGLRLARRTGADYVVPVGAGMLCAARDVTDDEELQLGSATMRALLTPGQAPHYTSYVLSTGGTDIAVFTGGSLLFGGVGRTDLLGSDLALELAGAQWDSAHRLAQVVAPAARVMSTHGFGSFCTIGGPVFGDWSLAGIGSSNSVFAEERQRFATDLIGEHGPYPSYFAHMAEINLRGTPDAVPPEPRWCEPAEAVALAGAGAWVLDVRPRRDFDEGHLRGSVSVDLEGAFATYAGWIVPWGTPIHLVADRREQLRRSREELQRIGIDEVSTVTLTDAGDPSLLASLPRSTGDELFEQITATPGLRLLDVRLPSEWVASHVSGARHVPVHELADRLEEIAEWVGEVPEGTDRRAWAYCGGGFRSAIAASMLRRAGIDAVHDDGSVVDLITAEAVLR